MITENRGGKRNGSGRKPLTKENSVLIRIKYLDGTFKSKTIRVSEKTTLEDVLKKVISLKSKKK
jgi:hypothetical protein